MSTTKISEYCDKCTKKSFNINTGLVCGLTNEKPNFVSTCPDFELDPKFEFIGSGKIAGYDGVGTELMGTKLEQNEELLKEQNLLMSIVSSSIAAIIGFVVWAIIASSTNSIYLYLVAGIGLFVGTVNRIFGKGIKTYYGFIGAAFSMASSFLGLLFSYVLVNSRYLELTIGEFIEMFGFFNIINTLIKEEIGLSLFAVFISGIFGFISSFRGSSILRKGLFKI